MRQDRFSHSSIDLTENNSRDYGIDMIRAVCIAFVLIWHLKPVTKSMMQMDSAAGVFGWLSISFIYHYVTLLAVPTFICISIMLFIKKSLSTAGYWKKRLTRLIQLFLFWTCIQFIVYSLACGGFSLPIDTIIPDGGPGLPHVGGSVFYFLFVLIICTGLAILFLKLSDKAKCIASIFIIVLSCLHFILSSYYRVPIKIEATENYCIYIPIAYYMVKYRDKLVRYRILFIFGYLFTVGYEVVIARGMTSAYGRLSIVFGVLSFISILLNLRFKRNVVMKFLSKYSLGIFSLHKYWQYVFVMLLGIIDSWISLPVYSESLIIFVTSVILTCLSVYLLGKTRLSVYVS